MQFNYKIRLYSFLFKTILTITREYNVKASYNEYFFNVLVVVMVMDEDSKYARPVAHLYKGQTFGVSYIFITVKRKHFFITCLRILIPILKDLYNERLAQVLFRYLNCMVHRLL
jgi:hypothetical protein